MGRSSANIFPQRRPLYKNDFGSNPERFEVFSHQRQLEFEERLAVVWCTPREVMEGSLMGLQALGYGPADGLPRCVNANANQRRRSLEYAVAPFTTGQEYSPAALVYAPQPPNFFQQRQYLEQQLQQPPQTQPPPPAAFQRGPLRAFFETLCQSATVVVPRGKGLRNAAWKERKFPSKTGISVPVGQLPAGKPLRASCGPAVGGAPDPVRAAAAV